MVDENDNGADNEQEIEILDERHPMAAGRRGEEEVEVYENNNDIIFGEPAGDADIIATNTNDNDEAVIFAYEAGDELAEDDNNNTRQTRNRRTGFFVSEAALQDDDLNATGEQLLQNAILYTWKGDVTPN